MYLLLAGSIVLIVLIFMFGVPLLFGLASKINSFRHTTAATTSQSDNLTPSVPQFSENFTATKSASITISGVADAGINIEIYQDDMLQSTVIASEDGTFKYDVDLNNGANNFTAIAVSGSGKKSDKSDVYTITYSNQPPKLELGPKDGDSVGNSPYSFSGKTDQGNSVTVNDHMAIISSDGSFSYFLSLSNGDNKVKVVASDPAGNQTTKEITIKYNP